MSFLFKKTKKPIDEPTKKLEAIEEEVVLYETFEDASEKNQSIQYTLCPIRLFSTTTMDNMLTSFNKNDFIPMMETFRYLGKELIDDIESHLGVSNIQETNMLQKFLAMYYDTDISIGSYSKNKKTISGRKTIEAPLWSNDFLLTGFAVADYIRVAKNILNRLKYCVRFVYSEYVRDTEQPNPNMSYHVDMALSHATAFTSKLDMIMSRYNHILNKEILSKPFSEWNEE